MSILMWFITRWQTYAVLAVLLIVGLLWLQFGGLLKGGRIDTAPTVQEGQATQEELDTLRRDRARLDGERKQQAERIGQLAREALASRASAEKWKTEAAQLRTQNQRIEERYRALPPVRSLQEGYDALRALGF